MGIFRQFLRSIGLGEKSYKARYLAEQVANLRLEVHEAQNRRAEARSQDQIHRHLRLIEWSFCTGNIVLLYGFVYCGRVALGSYFDLSHFIHRICNWR